MTPRPPQAETAGRLVVLALTAAMWTILTGPVTAQPKATPGQVLIMVDQSEAGSRHPTRQGADWAVETLMRSSSEALAVVVSGFADGTADYALGVTNSATDRQTVTRRMAEMPHNGKIANFETAFHRIADKAAAGEVAVAIIVGGADPTVVNQEARIIGESVRSDPRYQDITAQLVDLQQAQASAEELIEYFGPFYQERNRALTEAELPRLARSLGPRLLIIDTSGHSNVLRAAAKAASATYLPLSDNDPERQARRIGAAVTALLRRGDLLVHERPVFPGPGMIMAVVAGISLTATAVLLLRRRRYHASEAEPAAMAARPPPPPLPPPAPPAMSPRAPRPPRADLPLRAVISAGALTVSWRDADGLSHVDDATGLTTDEVSFRPRSHWTGGRVEAIMCPRLGIEIRILDGDMTQASDGSATVMLRRLGGGVDDRMKVISLLTRLEGL
jgi:hypothetical protein